MAPEPDLRFEDLDAAERRIEADEGVAADEVQRSDVPEPPPPDVQRCADGQEIPGMEVDCVVAVSSLCADRRVERGGAVKPSLCDDIVSDVTDVPFEGLLRLQSQSVVDELRDIYAEILSVVRSLGGNASRSP